MFCTNCGHPLADDVNFCPECGTPVYRSETVKNVESDITSDITVPSMAPDYSEPSVVSDETGGEVDPTSVVEPVPVLLDDMMEGAVQVSEETAQDLHEAVSEILTDSLESQEVPVNPFEEASASFVSAVENTIPDYVQPELQLPVMNDEQSSSPFVVADYQAPDQNPLDIPVYAEPVRTPDSAPAGSPSEPAVAIPVAQPAAENQYNYFPSEPQPSYVQQNAQVTPPVYAQPAPTPLAVPVGQNPPVNVKKSGGKGKWIILLLILALIGAVVGYLIHQNSPTVKFNKAMEAAETAYNDGDYIVAYNDYRDALSYMPDNPDAQQGFYYAADELAYAAYEEDDYDSAISYYEAVKREAPLYSSEADDYIKLLYSDWILNTASDGDYESAQSILSTAESNGYDMSEERDELDNMIANAAIIDHGRELVQTLTDYLDDGDYDAVFAFMDSDVYDFMNTELYESDVTLPVIYDITNGDYDRCGFFLDGGYMTFYYGEMDGAARNGVGETVCLIRNGTGSYRNYMHHGTWTNDLPNGEFVIYRYTNRGYDEEEVIITVDVTDGLFNGSIEYDYTDDDVYHGTFSNGSPVVIDEVDPNGDECYVIAYNDSKDAWIYRSTIDPNRKEGLLGFGE